MGFVPRGDFHGKKTRPTDSTYSRSSDSIHPNKHNVWGWIIVVVSVGLGWYITPHALRWWEDFVK